MALSLGRASLRGQCGMVLVDGREATYPFLSIYILNERISERFPLSFILSRRLLLLPLGALTVDVVAEGLLKCVDNLAVSGQRGLDGTDTA
jgi:hypothetical protein